MIDAIEYVVHRGGQVLALAADKNVAERNAWHLKGIKGNGMPPATALGEASHGLPGKSYGGLSVGRRSIDIELYADGFIPASCQAMLSDASRIVSTDNDALGYLRLMNSAGDWYRIAAKATDFDVSKSYRRAALVSMALDCPYTYFEDDTLHQVPIFSVGGGKEYPVETGGLERPYKFGDIVAGTGAQTVLVENAGDVAAPCVLRLFGAGLTSVEAVNVTTGASIGVSGMSVGGVEICTDSDNLYARFEDGTDASEYVSLYSYISDFVLVPGVNEIRVSMEASSVTAAGTRIEWRGRYTTCL